MDRTIWPALEFPAPDPLMGGQPPLHIHGLDDAVKAAMCAPCSEPQHMHAAPSDPKVGVV